jgi:2-polyprenyl-3-methyl-5-hydroxy-6-metoxy-1,4-benzoquinol methylase
MKTISCNLCGSEDASPHFQLPDWQLGGIEIQSHLVCCNVCGLIYQNPQLTWAELLKSYPPEYECFPTIEKQKRKSGLLKFLEYYGIKKRWKAILKRKSNGKLLDLGCATGIFLKGMDHSPQWELYGLEINEYAAAIAKRNVSANIFHGSLDDACYPTSYFDAITLWDVLEHVHDPFSMLKEIQRILKPTGIFVLRVPNYNSWEACLFSRYWAGYEPPRHLFVFGKRQIMKMCAKNGLKVIHSSADLGNYLVFVLSMRFLMQGKAINPTVNRLITRTLYHPVIRLLVSPFFYLISRIFNSSLITIVAEKP